MNSLKSFIAVSILSLLSSGAVQADGGKDQLGRVKFENSCDPGVKPLLETGVAMLVAQSVKCNDYPAAGLI